MMDTTTAHNDILDELVIRHGLIILTHQGGEKGRRYENGVITMRANLGPINYRCTLAHEIAHHVANDQPTNNPWIKARQERKADEQAAKWLISPVEYALAEKIHGPHPSAIAQELGVTVALVETWRSLYERIPL